METFQEQLIYNLNQVYKKDRGLPLIFLIIGEGLVTFDDLSIERVSLNNIMTIECFGNSTSTSVKATSQLFHVYDAPTTGLLNEISNTFYYKGKMEYIMPVLLAFDSNMGTISCKDDTARRGTAEMR